MGVFGLSAFSAVGGAGLLSAYHRYRIYRETGVTPWDPPPLPRWSNPQDFVLREYLKPQLSLIVDHIHKTAPRDKLTWSAVREFVVDNTRHPKNASSHYYAKITSQRRWDIVLQDLWAHANDSRHTAPEVLCFNATDLMILLLAELGLEARSVRAIATAPTLFIGNYPRYLDHTFGEVWNGRKWVAVDPFYNVEYRLGDGSAASADDLCAISDINKVTPHNSYKVGWRETGTAPLAAQDFFAAIEHRDMTGESVVVLNNRRADFNRHFMVDEGSEPTPLRDIIRHSVVNKKSPTLIELSA